MRHISIARDFSPSPAGRFPEDGPFNGEKFREEFLVPALREGGGVVVSLDDTNGFGSSFLEEAFGGLVRKHGFTQSELAAHLKITYQDEALGFYADSIADFIRDAIPE